MQTEHPTYSVRPAERLAGVSEYYFSRKLKEVAQMNADGLDVISLGVGSPDLPPSQATIERLCDEAHNPAGHGYMPYNGIPELRRAFAEWYARWFGVTLNPTDEILPLIGSKEGILHTTLAFVNPGEQVLVPNPGYPTYTSLSTLLGAEVVYYNLTEKSGWLPDWDELERIDTSKVKLMWVNYPHMPTGTNATPQLYERLVDFARRRNLIIVNDNPYSFILNDRPLSILSVEGAKECCIEFNSMSKSHNMPGWRIGMLASNPAFVSYIIKVKSNIDSGMFRAMQLAAATALEAERDWYDGNNRNYASRRRLAGQIMEALGCTYDPNQSGMFLWGRIPDKYADVEELTERVLHEARVFVVPGFIFGSNGARYIRLSLCCKEERLEEALKRINTSCSRKGAETPR
ncbi:MAG: aminotransferase class I/II-fold pyridoxal phosphate-dependent enzyme [Mediterranea sp.]|jgi:aspartate/methionine/tyrosine aminotransferase|nr:aminotransferase class I/II-fold pyridoxal phosphate-dependent enzyme [Mediterranea sp.]